MLKRIAWFVLFSVMLLPVSMPSAESAVYVRTASRNPIIATGPQRRAIRSTPIVYRKNRLFHVYGNTVRRISRLRNR